MPTVYGRARGCRMLRLAWAPMRDGVRLATTVFLPETPGRYPVVMQRTPYGRMGWMDGWDEWTRSGYVLVVQDTRGRNDSEGEFDPFLQEINDTPDTIRWVREQEWCDGRVGLMGPSYLAWIQTLGVSRGDGALPGALPDALLPTFAPWRAWERGFYNQGAMSLFLLFWWAAFDVGSRVNNNALLNMFDVEELCRRLPLETMDESAGAGAVKLWRNAAEHHTLDSFWRQYGSSVNLERYTMPTLQVCGWYDYYPAQMLEAWRDLVAAAKTPEQARLHKIVIGPWGHHHGLEPTSDGQRAVDFGPDSRFNSRAIYRSWFDRCFKGVVPADGLGERAVRIFVMGVNKWRDEDEWPLARTRYTDYFLHSAGHANTRSGDGALSRATPADEPHDAYAYDPDKPVMTRGGNHSIGPWNDAYKKLVWCGPCDQGPNEDRPDVLVYTGAPLDADLEVTGPVRVRLFAATSARDTDWVARLVDVHPDGKAINITEGMIRARFRARQWDKPELVTPEAVLEYDIDLCVTSNVFLRGHRIRLEITSSNFPLWDRNLNTGEHPNRSTAKAVARQRVFHDGRYPSRVILPVIGGA